jgi:hypothetical protein
VRYFFHIVHSITTYKDADGRRFASNEHAKAHGTLLARELAGDGGWEGWSLHVHDESGNEIARLPIMPP